MELSPPDLETLSSEYIQGINNLIKEHSLNTAVSFVYLPLPPTKKEHDMLYLHYLTEMTNNLPPTLLVHANSPVTSTTL